MRFYRVVISEAGGNEIFPDSLKGLRIESLLPSGQSNTAALDIELDIPVASYHTPAGQGFLKIWGLGLKDIGAAFNLNDKQIAIYGGMSKGLPLANPSQARLLVQGQIFQAFGNWVGTEQSVDLIFTPSAGNSSQPTNIVLNWQEKTTLAGALQTTLSAAFPKAKLDIQLSSRLTQNHDEPAFYGSLTELNAFLNPVSRKIITDTNYQGVQISYDGVTIKVTDLSTPPKPKPIAFTDLIGQPTWISPGVIQCKLVLRGDLDLFDVVTLPPSLVGNTASAMTSLTGSPANLTTFTGNYTITRMHHYGRFRQPDAASWNTSIDMIQQPAAVSDGSGVSGGL